jgi:hypothetical protein
MRFSAFRFSFKKYFKHKSHKLISANLCDLWLINEFYNLVDFQSVNQIYGQKFHSGFVFTTIFGISSFSKYPKRFDKTRWFRLQDQFFLWSMELGRNRFGIQEPVFDWVLRSIETALQLVLEKVLSKHCSLSIPNPDKSLLMPLAYNRISKHPVRKIYFGN